MTIIVICLIIAAFTPLLAKAPLGYLQAKQEGGYDNNNPRAQQAGLSGLGARALAAQNNAFEAFPTFAAGVLIALWAEANLATVQLLCVLHIVARLCYLTFYLANLATLRSLSWMVGFGCAIALMALAL
ncbi:MAPEG family protein [Halioxenophilus aromaticivorans]|uniref:MAPEG family protein n=1 Tax=Halioxenophilus aromaticivorans TaxID=1306992 RepID=A0AAV3U964_9ALTE